MTATLMSSERPSSGPPTSGPPISGRTASLSRRTIPSPVGELLLESDGVALTAVRFLGAAIPTPTGGPDTRTDDDGAASILEAAAAQLGEYFAGVRTTFEIPVRSRGTDFQQAVWSALTAIPFGATWTYRRLATELGRPTATRAVGAACGRNPVAIVVPCHRVLGADGTLTGYAGGTATKAALLALEARTMTSEAASAGHVGARLA